MSTNERSTRAEAAFQAELEKTAAQIPGPKSEVKGRKRYVYYKLQNAKATPQKYDFKNFSKIQK